MVIRLSMVDIGERCVPVCNEFLEASDWRTRANIGLVMGHFLESCSAIDALWHLAGDHDSKVRHFVVHSLKGREEEIAKEILSVLATDCVDEVASSAAIAISKLSSDHD